MISLYLPTDAQYSSLKEC